MDRTELRDMFGLILKMVIFLHISCVVGGNEDERERPFNETELMSDWSNEMFLPYPTQFPTHTVDGDTLNKTQQRNGTFGRKGSFLVYLSLYYKGNMRYLPLYLTPVLIILGVIGNVISFIILYKFTKQKKSSSDFYLCTLAVYDIGGLLCSSFPFWANTFLKADYMMRGQMSPLQPVTGTFGACQFWMYMSFNFRYLSHWTITIFSIERFLILKQPFEAAARFTVKRGFITTAVLFTITFLGNIKFFFVFDKVVLPTGLTVCKLRRMFYTATFVHLILMSFIPAILVTVFNTLIIRGLIKHRRQSTCVSGVNRKARESQVTRRVVAVSVAFIAMSIPFMAAAYYRNIRIIQGHIDFSTLASDIYSSCLSLYIANYACNFLLYCITGKRFRDAVAELFRCKKKSPEDLDSSTVDTASTMASPDRNSLDDTKTRGKESVSSDGRQAVLYDLVEKREENLNTSTESENGSCSSEVFNGSVMNSPV